MSLAAVSSAMNSPSSEYLLLFRDTNWDQGLSPEEIRRTLDAVQAWLDGLVASGRMLGGHPLAAEGRRLSGAKDRAVSDGPFAESKEAIAGYILIRAGDLDDATDVARSNPVLALGATIEVRPALPECPVTRRAKDRLALAGL